MESYGGKDIIAHNLDAKQRTEDVRLKELAPFNKMLLSEVVRKGLLQAGFVYPTVIQATAIPVGKSGLDLLVQSKSGTGKTLIFSTIILESYHTNVAEPQSLIVAPTREIAVQIEAVLNQIGRCSPGFRAVCVIGGLDVADDRKRLQGAKAVVGTPGRLLHLIQNEVLNTSQIRLLVLDEADKMYTQSFRQDMQRIQKALPAKRQTIACSATFSDNLDTELAKIMRNPLLISTEDRATLLVGIKQFAVELPEKKTSILEMQAKLDALRDIFTRIPFKQCLIFAGSQSRAGSYRNYLDKEGWPCELISGAQDQKTRLDMFCKFREFKTRILVATDLMSRGVDSEHVNLVINLELPTDVVTYLHRIGRAGRFGSHGIAISFVTSEKDCCNLKRIISQVGSGMNVLKFPPKKNSDAERDLWDFSDFDKECKQYGLFGNELLAPLASQDYASLSDTQDNVSNLADNICSNTNSSIDTKTFHVDSKDSALNMMDLLADHPEYNLQAPHNVLTRESLQSSSQKLPSSNTIDDASSIAADEQSVRSSQQEISRYQSLLMHKSAIPTLFEFLVDPKSENSAALCSDAAEKPQRKRIDLFEDYKKSVLNNASDKSLNEDDFDALTEVKTDGPQLTANTVANFKSLLIDAPVPPKSTLSTDIYFDYANFNDENSTSISLTSGVEDIDKATFILSVATPSPRESIEELQDSSLNISQVDSTSQSMPEVKHFPSLTTTPDVVPPDEGLSAVQPAVKLTVNVGAQIEIAPYPQPLQNSNAAAASPGGGDIESLSSDQDSLDSGSSTERGGSSGFDEKTTTSASSGIETSEAENHDDTETYLTSSGEEDDESFGEDSDNYEEATADQDLNEAVSSRPRLVPHSLNNSLVSYASSSSAYRYRYANERWLGMYWSQMTQVQDYMKWFSSLRKQRNVDF